MIISYVPIDISVYLFNFWRQNCSVIVETARILIPISISLFLISCLILCIRWIAVDADLLLSCLRSLFNCNCGSSIWLGSRSSSLAPPEYKIHGGNSMATPRVFIKRTPSPLFSHPRLSIYLFLSHPPTHIHKQMKWARPTLRPFILTRQF